MRLPFADRATRTTARDAAALATATQAEEGVREVVAPNRLSLLLLVFIGGVSSLALEMLGPRLMAPFFGTSLFIWANQIGFTVNLSAETLAQADAYAALGVAPVVVLLPAGMTKAVRTPAGRHVVVCPASLGSSDCLNCGICQQRDRIAIMGFPAHGSGARHVEAIFFGGQGL